MANTGGEDEGSASESDEEDHPLQLGSVHYSSLDTVLASGVTAALAQHGVATLTEALLPRKTASRAVHAFSLLRDEASISCVFANPSSQKACPGACEAIHVDDSVLALLHAGDRRLEAALKAAIAASEKAARAALLARGYTDVVRAGLPMAAVGQAALIERWHKASDGCPSSGRGELLLTAVLTLDDLGSEGLRVLMPPTKTVSAVPSASDTSGGARRGLKRPRAAGIVGQLTASKHCPTVGQLTLIAPEAIRASVIGPGAVSLTTWYRSATPTTASAATAAAALPPAAAASLSALSAAASAAALGHGPAVYDNVLDAAALAQLVSTRPIRWALYDRQASPPRNAQERVIETLLVALGDDSRWVEYWGRPRWSSVPAHFDCDEGGLVRRRERQHPTSGHVLYLDVPPDVRGPTVLWRPVARGSEGGGSSSDGNEGAKVFTVPAVSGRLLRFSGSWVHGVPRPAREYIGEGDDDEEEGEEAEASSEEEEQGEEQDEGEEEEDEEEDGEEEGEEEGEEDEGKEEEDDEEEEGEEEEEEVRRLVLLFNTWNEAPPSPDDKADAPEAAKRGELTRYDDDVPAACTPRASWRPASFVTDVEGSGAAGASTAFVARLMGTPLRRGSAMRYRVDDLVATRSAVRAALTHASEPHRFDVR